MKTLTEVRQEREQAVLMNKLAAIQETLGDDPVIVSTLDAAIDVVKEAGVTDPSEQLDLAVQMTMDHLGLNKEAEATEDTESLEFQNAARAGVVAAEVAHAAGVTIADIEKIASDEEADAFGSALGRAVVKAVKASQE